MAYQMQASPLPPGWEPHWSPDYQIYYYLNTYTKETTWTIPTIPAQTPAIYAPPTQVQQQHNFPQTQTFSPPALPVQNHIPQSMQQHARVAGYNPSLVTHHSNPPPPYTAQQYHPSASYQPQQQSFAPPQVQGQVSHQQQNHSAPPPQNQSQPVQHGRQPSSSTSIMSKITTPSFKKWGKRAAIGIGAIGAVALGADIMDGGLFDGGSGGGDFGGGGDYSGGGGDYSGGDGGDSSAALQAQYAMEAQGQQNALMLLDPPGTTYVDSNSLI